MIPSFWQVGGNTGGITLPEDEQRLCKPLKDRYIRSVLKDVLSCGPERPYLTCK